MDLYKEIAKEVRPDNTNVNVENILQGHNFAKSLHFFPFERCGEAFTYTRQQNISYDLHKLDFLEVEKNNFLLYRPNQCQRWRPRIDIWLIVFIRFLIDEHVIFLFSVTCQYNYSFYQFLIKLSWRQNIIKILPGISKSMWRITKIPHRNQIQTDPSFNGLYAINKQIPTIQVAKWW